MSRDDIAAIVAALADLAQVVVKPTPPTRQIYTPSST